MRPLPKQILTFLFFVILFSGISYYIVIHSGHLSVGNGLVVGFLMWCPAFAAFATCELLKIDIGTLGWSWRPTRYVAWGYIIPVLYGLPVYLACWWVIRGSFDFAKFAEPLGRSYGFPESPRATAIFIVIPLYASIGVISSAAPALGEEIGWRGFLLPRLVAQAGFTWGCLTSGCIWAVWHYPLLLFADYNAGTKPAFALTCFTLMVIADACILGWLRLKSGSLWPAAILHASHNLFIQAIFDRMTAPVGKALYVTTEFGAGMVFTIAAVALYFWSRRAEVMTRNQMA